MHYVISWINDFTVACPVTPSRDKSAIIALESFLSYLLRHLSSSLFQPVLCFLAMNIHCSSLYNVWLQSDLSTNLFETDSLHIDFTVYRLKIFTGRPTKLNLKSVTFQFIKVERRFKYWPMLMVLKRGLVDILLYVPSFRWEVLVVYTPGPWVWFMLAVTLNASGTRWHGP